MRNSLFLPFSRIIQEIIIVCRRYAILEGTRSSCLNIKINFIKKYNNGHVSLAIVSEAFSHCFFLLQHDRYLTFLNKQFLTIFPRLFYYFNCYKKNRTPRFASQKLPYNAIRNNIKITIKYINFEMHKLSDQNTICINKISALFESDVKNSESTLMLGFLWLFSVYFSVSITSIYLLFLSSH